MHVQATTGGLVASPGLHHGAPGAQPSSTVGLTACVTTQIVPSDPRMARTSAIHLAPTEMQVRGCNWVFADAGHTVTYACTSAW